MLTAAQRDSHHAVNFLLVAVTLRDQAEMRSEINSFFPPILLSDVQACGNLQPKTCAWRGVEVF